MYINVLTILTINSDKLITTLQHILHYVLYMHSKNYTRYIITLGIKNLFLLYFLPHKLFIQHYISNAHNQ